MPVIFGGDAQVESRAARRGPLVCRGGVEPAEPPERSSPGRRRGSTLMRLGAEVATPLQDLRRGRRPGLDVVACWRRADHSTFRRSGWLALQGIQLRPGHTACQPIRRALREGALTRQDSRSTATRAGADHTGTRSGNEPSTPAMRPTFAALGVTATSAGGLFTACLSSRGAVLQVCRRSWCVAVCSETFAWLPRGQSAIPRPSDP
jgi:hypothetical protein